MALWAAALLLGGPPRMFDFMLLPGLYMLRGSKPGGPQG